MWDFLLIDLKDIVSPIEREQFSETELESLANLIVEIGGILRPVILKKIGFERFEVINGHLDYYASLLAKEKDPTLETVNAFVIDSEVEEIALQQTRSFVSLPTKPDGKRETDVEELVNGLERRLEKQFKTLREEYQKEIQSLTKKVDSLTPPPPPPPISILTVLNSCGIDPLLKVKIPQKYAENFIKMRGMKRFDSLQDIIKRVDGVGDKRLIALIDYLLDHQ